MSSSPEPSSTRLEDLAPGEQVEVEHTLTIGPIARTVRTRGKLLRVERRLAGLHFRRNHDDKVAIDTILLELPDGERTTVTMDPATVLRRV